MSYYNSLTYVQCHIDHMLRDQRKFAQTYVNDIVIFLVFLNEHIKHLQDVFEVLLQKNISLSSDKFFLNYSFIHLLDQQMNTLRLAIIDDKLRAIISLEFSKTLSQLKKYLEMTEYLRQYILHYVIIIKSLQLRKIMLNREIQDIGDNVRK